MSAATEILEELRVKGISIRAQHGVLHLKPKNAIDAQLLGRIREAKPEILAVLRRPPVVVLVESRPADPVGEAVRAVLRPGEEITPKGIIRRLPKGVCEHCGGKKFCNCAVCNRGWGKGWFGWCHTCGGSGRVQ